MYSAKSLANYIINKCIDDECVINNLQLNFILCLIQETYLNSKSCAFYEEIRKCKFGYVVPSVYYSYCMYGAYDILISRNKTTIKADKLIDKIIDEGRKVELTEIRNIEKQYRHIPARIPL